MPQHLKKIILLVGLILLIINLFLGFHIQTKVACVALVMSLWWIFEILPLGVTALIPVFAFPLLNIMPAKKIAPVYMSPILMIFIGGFLMAAAIQKWNLHRRIALKTISFFGHQPSQLILGFMIATAFLSMWISNTATTVMMISIALSVITCYEEKLGVNENSRQFASALMLSIAYSASIGGISTPIGTPPNLAFIRLFEINFPNQEVLSFSQWMSFAFPTALFLFTVVWLILTKFFLRSTKIKSLKVKVITDELNQLGKFTAEEKKVAVVFTTMVLLWIFRKGFHLGDFYLPGWSSLLTHPHYIDDGSVAILCALSLFLLPAQKGKKLLDGQSINEIPWQTILLFGGGFALAKGIQDSGLSQSIGFGLKFLGNYPIELVISALSFSMSFLTELTSNTASTELLLPIIAAISKETGFPPLSLMIPITLAASCAFMLPAATPPNALIFGSQRVKMMEMIKYGFIINILCATVISLVGIFILPYLF